MKQQTPFVQFENIQKSYDGKSLIVKDLNLDIYRGEFLTLLGPSGSGKTTSLMMLAGFETSTSGKITLGGKVLNQLPPALLIKSKVGWSLPHPPGGLS